MIRQPSAAELTYQQVGEAIRRGLLKPEQKRSLSSMRHDFEIPDPDRHFSIQYDNGMITWNLSPSASRMRYDGRRRSEAQMRRLMKQKQDQSEAAARKYERRKRAFIVAAMGEIPDPITAIPLLDSEDARSVPVTIAVQGFAMTGAPGAAGVSLVRASAGRSAVSRTIPRIGFAPIRAIKTYRPDEDYMVIRTPVVSGPPQLVVNTGTFSGAEVNKLAFRPDGRYLAAAGDVVRIWDVESGDLLHTLRGQRSWGSTGGCTDLSFTPDGRQLLVATAGFDDSLRVYDMAAPNDICEVHQGHTGHIERLAISPDGRWLVTYGEDKRLQIWNWPKRSIEATFSPKDPIDHLSFPTRNPNVLTIAGNGNYEWMATNGGATMASQFRTQLQQRLNNTFKWPFNGTPHPFAIDVDWANDRWLIGGRGETNSRDFWVGYRAGASAYPVAMKKHEYFVTACDLSADGTLAASADAMGNVLVWETATQRNRHKFESRTKAFYSVGYDRDDGLISYSRKPYAGSKWKRNQYGALAQAFDFRRRQVRTVTPKPPPVAVSEQGGFTLEWGGKENPVLTARRGQGVEATQPFYGSARLRPTWHSFLRGRDLGFNNAVIMGSDAGSLVCLDPTARFVRRGDFIRWMNNDPLSKLRHEVVATGEWKYKTEDVVTVEIQRGSRVFEREIRLTPTGDAARPLFSMQISTGQQLSRSAL